MSENVNKPEDVAASPQPGQSPQGAESLADLKAPNIFKEFFLFLKEEKVWWLAPMIVVLLLVGILLLVGQSAPALAPFLYPLF